ncbi:MULTISPECIES: cyclase family protein [Bradyrhizobium]|uniref:Polyketide cyclase n=1 Tax=Bradyrhizobium yuanmingense TaxID=108015 RepID=A0A0R3C681_9BRAD|nr:MULTISPECIES: cyclase family protein [Bradyrhizobium]MCA1385974.1 cyclase family protein [Bradyrhizobium sp. BRP05]KRP90321.1 polyketide cyclase [Bradyrhizobium yuanmingense]MCA1418537.1 cyclase family protein [Bradyrhizobium sp. BRP23]MCA1430127.1 cyclase family protein [Bradyrhizobium sp. NBAIM16]MCA1467014.1 cyclase family protein [Bradyrhizobium sp. IC3195]
MRNTLVLCCVAALSAISGTASAQDWTKSKWGPNDEIGAANYMTPELVVKAASLVKTGKTYALGIPVTPQTPAYPPRTFKLTIVQPGQAGTPGLGPNKATYNDDILDSWVGIGSQLDGLGHLGVEHVYYNGNKLADFADPNGLKKLGIEKVPPMVARGVLLDMAAYFKTDVVKEGTAFNVKEIEEAAKQQNVEIRQGDVVIFHTGWLSLIGKDDKRYSAGEPGLGVEGAKYLAGKGVVAVGADTWGLEVLPFEGKTVFEVHQILLAMNGTYILENMDTAALARDKGYEFLFVLGQPRWTGAVQAMINPIAIR